MRTTSASSAAFLLWLSLLPQTPPLSTSRERRARASSGRKRASRTQLEEGLEGEEDMRELGESLSAFSLAVAVGAEEEETFEK